MVPGSVRGIATVAFASFWGQFTQLKKMVARDGENHDAEIVDGLARRRAASSW
jgi:hypothetical protein